ncbi:MAG TPA: hypothetical protein VEH80_10050 [Candidatus Bathyarchaeia archaeon]|nr:hypothetical protein [Candidatus Bathyarchaeia archaeon]
MFDVVVRGVLGCGGDCATRPPGMPVWLPPGRGFNARPVEPPGGVVDGVLPGVPVAALNALLSFPPGAIGFALVPVRAVAPLEVDPPEDRLGGGVGLLKPLALLNDCVRGLGLGVGRGGLSRDPANPLLARKFTAANTTAEHSTIVLRMSFSRWRVGGKEQP